jgi:hypothetical protein
MDRGAARLGRTIRVRDQGFEALRALGLGAIAAVVHVVAGRISGSTSIAGGTARSKVPRSPRCGVTTVFIAVMNPFLLGHLAPILRRFCRVRLHTQR